jgi:hypothetical protein
LESALANASRILPLVTTAHLPSAACDAYWPEIYWNQPVVAEERGNPYGDTPSPKTFQNVSPLDPQLFSRMSDFADELLKGERSGKYSPIEVAQWLEGLAGAALNGLSHAEATNSTEVRRLSIDVRMQAGLGRFFAAKFRRGVLYSIHERTGDRLALEEALKAYRAARDAWAQVAELAKGVYAADLSTGERNSVRGQWAGRLAAIDRDLAQMEQRLPAAKPSDDPRVAAAIEEVLGKPRRPSLACRHRPPRNFRPKEAAPIAITVPAKLASVRLYYRHVNQAERYQTVDMESRGNTYRASIPGEYTDSPYPLQYYFELRESPAKAWLYPGFAPDLANQPYFVLPRA